MRKLHFSIMINAPKQKVWDTMLQDKTYRQWTDVFSPDTNSISSYEGEWVTGSPMRFVGSDKDGNKSGMISRIKEVRPLEFVSIEHLGVLENGKETMWTETEKGPNGAFENYTFNEKDSGTEVLVDLDTIEDWASMFEEMWPKALEKLKAIAEQ